MATITAPIILDSTGQDIVNALLLATVVPEEIWNETSGSVSVALQPNKFYHFTGDLTTLNIGLSTASTGIAQYHFDFTTGTGTTLSMPADVQMPDNFAAEDNTHYEIDIFNGYATVQSWTVQQGAIVT